MICLLILDYLWWIPMFCLLEHKWNVLLNYLVAFSDKSRSKSCEHRGQRWKNLKFISFKVWNMTPAQMIKEVEKWGENTNINISYIIWELTWNLLNEQVTKGVKERNWSLWRSLENFCLVSTEVSDGQGQNLWGP